MHYGFVGWEGLTNVVEHRYCPAITKLSPTLGDELTGKAWGIDLFSAKPTNCSLRNGGRYVIHIDILR